MHPLVLRLFAVLIAATLVACQLPGSPAAVAEIRGTVTVLEAGATYQLIEVVNTTTAVAIMADAAQQWRAEQCYSVTYFDPDTAPDGTLAGEPSVLHVTECAP